MFIQDIHVILSSVEKKLRFLHLKPFEQFALKLSFGPVLNRLVPIEVHYMEKNPGMFSSKTLISFGLKKERHGHLG